MNEIRVPAKVVRYWSEGGASFDDPMLLFCGLDDGRVYVSVKVPDDTTAGHTRQWALHTPAMTDR